VRPFITSDSLSADEDPWKPPPRAQPPRRGERNRVRQTWRVGSVGRIACGVIGMLGNNFLVTPAVVVIAIIGDLLYTAAVLLFAIGLSRQASVVARKPLGVTAMSVVAVSPLLATLFSQLSAPSRTPDSSEEWMILTYLLLIVPAGAGLIAAVQIGRAGVVIPPWRWAPLWVLTIHVTAWASTQILYRSLTPDTLPELSGLTTMPGTLAFLTGTLGLGILGLLITPHRPHTTNISPSRLTLLGEQNA
jgi:hypothetical protein